MATIKIIATEDGSHTLLNEELQETYHSRHGALQESAYVFIAKGLDALVNPHAVNIFEVGFGTGLNALLAERWSSNNSIPVTYCTLEKYPIPDSIWSSLNYCATQPETETFERIHRAAWHQWIPVSPYFSIFKMNETLQDSDLSVLNADLVFFDAFAPNKQPEMWTLPMLAKVAGAMKTGALFVTYCAKGQLKRDLKSLGLQVESLPGPPGKREMVRAVKL